MAQSFFKFVVGLWNRWVSRGRRKAHAVGLLLGFAIADEAVTNRAFYLSATRRMQHVVIVGRTGSGKTSWLLNACESDVNDGRGFIFPALHSDVIPAVMAAIAHREQMTGADFSDRVIVIDPCDPTHSVGLNVLHQDEVGQTSRAAEQFAEVLRVRWHLDQFGARTDELLRNSLYTLAVNGCTLVELAPFLTQPAFRASCVQNIPDGEIKQYFEWRFDKSSDAMQRVMAEPILNRTSSFTSNPYFRHLVGQQNSTFSLRQAIDEGKWILLNLDKGLLGEHALTFGSLFLTLVKNALFLRRRRELFSIFCDEVQNFVSDASSLETMFSEARKHGVGVVTANQFLDQLSTEMRAAMMAVGTHVFFQLSAPDAQHVSSALDGGKPLAELLKNLRQRHMVVKTGGERWQEVVVPTVRPKPVNYADLHNRSRARWARSRVDIDAEISRRLAAAYGRAKKVIDDWD